MADFENGLPPASTDMTGKKVSNVSINTLDAESIGKQDVSAVKILTVDAEIASKQAIKAVSLSTEQVGRNRVFFYL